MRGYSSLLCSDAEGRGKDALVPANSEGLDERAGLGSSAGGLDTLETMDILYGLHPVEEAVRAGSRVFDHVCLARDRADAKLERIAALCRERGIRLRMEPRDHLTELAKTAAHQGVVAIVRAKALSDLEDLLEPRPGRSLLLLALDGVGRPAKSGRAAAHGQRRRRRRCCFNRATGCAVERRSRQSLGRRCGARAHGAGRKHDADA